MVEIFENRQKPLQRASQGLRDGSTGNLVFREASPAELYGSYVAFRFFIAKCGDIRALIPNLYATAVFKA